ncbi:HSF-type DNA-binding-domain-containing protein [Annulohypoxylon truncatum]|uniref:HSF-type DNA-binding-domain-containing protein n=1 Tax=Annulohypoxylon truncatum TaxID=327061 RepID=UPI0020071E51|nr:HSF-type DNA-binding-domain-containing protein [Annulohypoxylon truncatum]KAI1204220.1 HSF-type DNA-binding-domain-containing protein [Annulohypoxylon truncatum]
MPPEGDIASMAQGAGNNSSDFVRKLYKMLEDPAYSEVVRWGNEGDSFVVLENEKFTKTILPKHFKHSNFASFVRQLNKYDFHKVRHNEENGQSPYGASAWEFKHPEFRADRKDNLDNIRRKAPAPRKVQATEEQYGVSNQQVLVLSETLAATQQQVQQLQESYHEIVNANKIFVDEILHLQKLVRSQNQVHNELINHLNKVEQERKESSRSSGHATSGYGSNTANLLSDGSESPLELRRARDILNGLQVDHVADRDLNRMSVQLHQAGGSPESAGSSGMMGPPGVGGANPFLHDPLNDMRHLVYPVGQTIGIDPFAAEHINNLPYNRPVQDNAMGPSPEFNGPPMHSQTPPGGPSQSGSPWGSKKPVVLLVEDDRTCSRIGSKFLAQYDCGVEVARDGLEAVNKVNAKQHYYDLIFMDIVMPQLDGVSATAMIREVQPNTPIIAMTSNINQQDLEMYFHWGMRDVLAKPFTKEGMIGKLRKHLANFMRNPPPESMMDSMYPNGAPGQPPTPGPYSNQGIGMAPLSAASSGPVGKFDTTPIQSPATSASWHSPSQMPHASPTLAQDQGYLNAGSGSQMVLTPGGTQKPQYANAMMPQMGMPPQQRMPEGIQRSDGPPEKRQRLYAPQGNYNP